MQIGEWQYGVPTMSFIRNERNSFKRDKNLKKHSMLKITSDGSRMRENHREDGIPFAKILYANGDLYEGYIRKRT